MKIKLDLHGVVFEYERKPMPERRFRALCTLAAVAAYLGMVVGATALCGFLGLVVTVGAAFLIVLALNAF